MNRIPIETTRNNCRREGIGRKGLAMPSEIVFTFLLHSYIPFVHFERGKRTREYTRCREAVHLCSHPRSTGEDAVAGETAENLVKIAIADFLKKLFLILYHEST